LNHGGLLDAQARPDLPCVIIVAQPQRLRELAAASCAQVLLHGMLEEILRDAIFSRQRVKQESMIKG
jgi:hypothetical protein